MGQNTSEKVIFSTVHRDDPDDPSLPIAVEDDHEEDLEPATTSPPQTPTLVAVPELTHPGDSATNGLAERSVRSIEEQSRTFLAAIEARIKIPIPSEHPLIGWIVEHAAYVLNHFLVGTDHQTPYQRLHGKISCKIFVEFGEKILWFIPKRLMSKLDPPWRYGIF